MRETIFKERHVIINATSILLALMGVILRGSWISYFFSVTSLIAVFYNLFKENKNTPIKFLFEFVYSAFAIFGVLICNVGNLYLYELNRYGYENGSFSIIVLYYVVFWIALLCFDKKKNFSFFFRQAKEKESNLKDVAIKIALLVFGLSLFIPVMRHPSFELDMGRFAYRSAYMDGMAGLRENIAVCLLPLLLLGKKKKAYITVICLLPFILYGIWTGSKFGLFFNIAILFASILPEIKRNKKTKTKRFFMLLISAFALILIPYYAARGENPIESIYERGAQQGQLLWAVTNETNGVPHLDELDDEVNPLIDEIQNKPIRKTYGVYKMMDISISANSSIKNDKILNGVRYSSQGVDIAYYYFGYAGIIIHAIIRAFFEVLLVNLLIAFYRKKDMLGMFCAAFIILIKHSIFTQGDLYKTLSLWFILCLSVVIVKYLLNLKRAKNEK